MTGQDEFKQKLVVYNGEDCLALRRVAETLASIGDGQIVPSSHSAVSYVVQSGTISATLTGSGGLVKTTSGTVTLWAANTYTGWTVMEDGILELGRDDAIPSWSMLIRCGGEIRFL
jgi:autotransporter-associated beta strand protein